jgi:hypothetical protein
MTHNFLQQGAITLNNSVDISKFKQREQLARHHAGKEGSTIYKNGTDQQNAIIHQGDLVFAMKPTTRNARHSAQGLPVYSSMNGFMVNPQDEEPLEQQIMIMGVAKGTVNPFSPAQPNEGVATYYRGTSDVWYNCASGKHCYPGTMLMYKVPDIKGTDFTPHFTGKPPTKIDIQVEPFCWDGIKFETERISRLASFANEDSQLIKTIDVKARLVKNSKTTATIKKAATITAACRTLEVLVRRGLVKIMTPEEKEKEKLLDDFIKNNGDPNQFKRDYKGVTKTSVLGGTNLHFDADTAEQLLEKNYTEIKSDADSDEAEAQLESIMWICRILGIGGSVSYPTSGGSMDIGAQPQVQKDVFYSNLWPHVSNKDSATLLSLQEVYKPLKEFAPKFHRSHVQRAARDTMDQYTKLAWELPYLVEHVSAEARRTELSKIIGTALSYGDPTAVNPRVSTLLGRPFGF